MQSKLLKVKTGIILFSVVPLVSSVLFAQSYNANTASDEITRLTGPSGLSYNHFISGNFRTQYYGRWSEDDQSDHTMFEYLRFNTKEFYNKKVTMAGSARLTEDLDGNEPENGAFRDILDSYDHDVNGRLYYLYADIKNPIIDKSNLRIGRQYLYSVETILFDGSKYEQQIGPVDTYAFGGFRVSQYSNTYFDTVVGGGIAARPLINTRINIDYVRIVDDNFIDDEVSLSLWQKIYEDFNFYGRYTLLESTPKDFVVKVSWDKVDWDASVQVSYYRFFHSLDEHSNNISPFYEILSELEPFELVSLTGYKGLGDKFGLSGGIDHRNVLDKKDEDTSNHDYNRAFLSFDVNNVLLKDSKVSFIVEYWNADGMDHSADLGVDFDKKIGKFHFGGGTSYSLYKYNFVGNNDLASILNDESTDTEQKINVRTYYLRLKYSLTRQSDISLNWLTEVSDTDPEKFHELLLSYSVSF